VRRLSERVAGGSDGETDEQLLERTRKIANGSVAAPLRRLRLEGNRCWTVGARWIARVIEVVAHDLKLSVTFGLQQGVISPDMRQALTHLLCSSKLSNATLVAEEIGPGTSLYREAMLGYQDFLERKRSSASVRRSGPSLPASPRDSGEGLSAAGAQSTKPATPRTPRTPNATPRAPNAAPPSPASSRPPLPAEPPATEVWANLMSKRSGTKVSKYLRRADETTTPDQK